MKHLVPGAEHVGWAVVAACKITGEDPIACADGTDANSKARHYALHALVQVFRGRVRGSDMAVLVGFRSGYRRSEAGRSFRISAQTIMNRAEWWSDIAYGGVIAAVEAVSRPGAGVQAPAEVEGYEVRAEPPRSPAASLAPRRAVVPSEPVERRPQPVAISRRTPHPLPGTGSKQALRDMLADAVRNTAAQAPPDDS